MALFPFIFVRGGKLLTATTLNHEKIHFAQQKEMLVVFFYLWYFIEWIFKGYKNISLEKEAYDNQDDLLYLETRKHYNWIKWL